MKRLCTKYLEKKVLEYFGADYQYKDICALLKKNDNVEISVRTLKKLLKKKGLKRKNLRETSVEEIVAAVHIELENSGYNMGYRSLWKKLRREYDMVVKQRTVLKILQIVDPEGVAQRKMNKLRRRTYRVPGPNFLWHMDGYDKIKRFGFAIHGCIDGYSKKLLWLEVASSNNDPGIIAYYYLSTVAKLKYLPTRIRSDKGTENTIVESLQQCLRYDHEDEYAGENSFVTGKSTANQRIESSWCILRKQVTGFYIDLFKKMEDEGILDTSNWLHIESLKFCFGNLICNDLHEHMTRWNEHPVRKQRARGIAGGKPNLLYMLPSQFGAEECKKPINLDAVKILFNKYARTPQLIDEQFLEIVREINPPEISTAEDALVVFLELSVLNLNM